MDICLREPFIYLDKLRFQSHTICIINIATCISSFGDYVSLINEVNLMPKMILPLCIVMAPCIA